MQWDVTPDGVLDPPLTELKELLHICAVLGLTARLECVGVGQLVSVRNLRKLD
jgi:hypothetical protein